MLTDIIAVMQSAAKHPFLLGTLLNKDNVQRRAPELSG
jgi:hypothetical protein